MNEKKNYIELQTKTTLKCLFFSALLRIWCLALRKLELIRFKYLSGSINHLPHQSINLIVDSHSTPTVRPKTSSVQTDIRLTCC